MTKIFDYEINKINLWERFLLLFVKSSYARDKEGNVFVSTKCKKMFGKVYVLREKISIKRTNKIKVGDDKMKDNTIVCECQNCERHFEIEVKGDEEITCPYCHSGDVITYEDGENG